MRTLALVLCATALLGTTGAQAADPSPYAPLDRPGPALSVPAAALEKSLVCDDLSGATRDPVLLVPGTNLEPQANFGGNYLPAFAAAGRPTCTVELPGFALDDIQVAAEHVVYAVREVARRSGRKVDVVGYSQGGMLPRWALRFWPDVRLLVDDVVGLAPSNHGTLDSEALCQAGSCPAAYWQQATGSQFVQALNSGTETFAGIDYTVAYTRFDQVVTPNLDEASGSSSLRTGDGAVSNTALQDVCPANVADHLAIGSYDPVGYALVVDALDRDGPADPARIDPTVCTQPFQPGVDPQTFASDQAGLLATIAQSAAAATLLPAEPPLRDYVFAARAAAPVVRPAVPVAAPARPVLAPARPQTGGPGPVLATTGGTGPALLGAGLVLLGLAQRRRVRA